MSNCINNKCDLCHNLVISTSVTVVAVGGVDTLVIDIPAGGCYCNGKKVCLVIAQTIPETATINQPVAISIGGDSDTIGAITGSIAEAYWGIPEEIKKYVLFFLPIELGNAYSEFKFYLKEKAEASEKNMEADENTIEADTVLDENIPIED